LIIKKNPNLDEEAKMDENRIKIGDYYFYIHNMDECRNILLHCNILYSQLSFTANMKTKTLVTSFVLQEYLNRLAYEK
jgi:hypothetical protein